MNECKNALLGHKKQKRKESKEKLFLNALVLSLFLLLGAALNFKAWQCEAAKWRYDIAVLKTTKKKKSSHKHTHTHARAHKCTHARTNAHTHTGGRLQQRHLDNQVNQVGQQLLQEVLAVWFYMKQFQEVITRHTWRIPADQSHSVFATVKPRRQPFQPSPSSIFHSDCRNGATLMEIS